MHKCIRNVLQCKINQMRQESARHKKLSPEHSWHTGEKEGTKWTCWQMHLVYNCTDPTGAAFQGGRKSPCLCAGDRKLSKKKLTFTLVPDLQETPSQVLLSTTGGMDRLMNNKQNPFYIVDYYGIESQEIYLTMLRQTEVAVWMRPWGTPGLLVCWLVESTL